MDYYAAVEMDELYLHATTRMHHSNVEEDKPDRTQQYYVITFIQQ